MSCLLDAEGRRLALALVSAGTRDLTARVVAKDLLADEVSEEGREGGELAVDSGSLQASLLESKSQGDHHGAAGFWVSTEVWGMAASQEGPVPTDGNLSAWYYLGLAYTRGEGVEQDNTQALALLQAAAGQGHKGAKRFLEGISKGEAAAEAAPE